MTPLDRTMRRLPLALFAALLASTAADAQLLREPPRGEAVERHLPGDRTLTQWVHDADLVNTAARLQGVAEPAWPEPPHWRDRDAGNRLVRAA